jgi:hypothetical protein
MSRILFCSYTSKKKISRFCNLEFFCLWFLRENIKIYWWSAVHLPRMYIMILLKKYISLRLRLDMSSLNSSPVDTNALNGSFQCAAGIYCLLPLVNYADSCHRCFSVKVLSMDHVVCCMIRTISHIKMAVIYVITSIFPIKEFLQIRQHS